MPASGVFPASASSDMRAAVYGIELLNDAAGAGGEFRAENDRFFFASKVVLQSGVEPSYAVAEIPLTQFEESAPSIAAVNGGALKGLRIGTRALVFVYSAESGTAAPLLCGSVVNIQQDLGSDGAALTIFDDRWLLRGVPVAGQFIYQPDGGDVVYRQRGPARFNPDGRPNCLDSGGGPLFAPYPGYGREDGDSDPQPGAATKAARPWRLSDIAAYLRRTLCTGDLAAQTAAFPWFQRLDANRVIVPATFGMQLESDNAEADARAAAGFNSYDRENGAAGKAPDLTLEGMDLLSALTRIAASAGAWALFCGASEEQTFSGGRRARSVLEFVPTRYLDSAARTLNVLRPASGNITDSAGRIGVIDGQVEEDGAELFTSVVVAGDPVQLERRVEFSSGGVGLEAAWNSDDEESFRAYVTDHPDYPNSAQAFLEACWKFPRVFAAYQVPRDFDYLAGTKYAGFPRVNAHAPILPHLLTTFSERSGANKRRVFPRQVSVELKDDAGDYRARSTLDGLEVDDDGTLWLTTHREAGLSDPESGTWKGELSDADTLLPRDLRITLSLQMDHRLCAALSLSGSATSPAADPNAEAAAVATGTSRQYFASAGSAYVEQLRYGSWPVPQSLDGSTSESDRATDGNELKSDAEKAQTHAQRRLAQVGRVKKTTRLLFPSPMLFKPGQSIAMLDNRGLTTGSFPLRGVVSRVVHRYEDNTTEIELS